MDSHFLDKLKWNNLPLRGFNSLFSNAAYTNMYPISIFGYTVSIVSVQLNTKYKCKFKCRYQ
ncbi:hypothetical protein psyc5s11_34930 [Clostridium gelidum]|uniref:Uncharacterized protein n=1 Tax=Clostridium gelidum TaxID=704125 RepID=A0ABM7T6V7_9CLOT|nr:hypothetical protein psyc5s11_34930 [Clostridium gelidum]